MPPEDPENIPATETETETATPVAVFNCPQCGEQVDVLPADGEPWMICPHCKAEFVTTESPTPEEDAEALEQEAEKARRRAEELDNLRIRNVAHARRSAIRSRSYVLIGALVCAVAIGQLIYLTITHVRDQGWDIKPIGYILLIFPAMVGIRFFLRRARALQEEVSRSALSEPTVPPDFSTLSDGSQQWKNLEDVK